MHFIKKALQSHFLILPFPYFVTSVYHNEDLFYDSLSIEGNANSEPVVAAESLLADGA